MKPVIRILNRKRILKWYRVHERKRRPLTVYRFLLFVLGWFTYRYGRSFIICSVIASSSLVSTISSCRTFQQDILPLASPTRIWSCRESPASHTQVIGWVCADCFPTYAATLTFGINIQAPQAHFPASMACHGYHTAFHPFWAVRAVSRYRVSRRAREWFSFAENFAINGGKHQLRPGETQNITIFAIDRHTADWVIFGLR